MDSVTDSALEGAEHPGADARWLAILRDIGFIDLIAARDGKIKKN
jgi:hypothetical protein